VFGRRQSAKQVSPSGEIITRSRGVPENSWRATIRDHHEGYIDWDQFVANRERLAANRTNGEVLPSPAREGLCLLQGIALCGQCGRRLSPHYTGNAGIYPVYQCTWKCLDASAPRACLAVPATPLDQAIAARPVNAVTPVTIDLALAALADLETRDREISGQWRMRIERARYEAELAERRYESVDPSNRLIAATLEQRWNDAMQRLHELEAELAAFQQHTMRVVTAEQKRQIMQLAEDFPRLWTASTTTHRDRKRILRLLVRDVTVSKGSEPKTIRLNIRWQGGATETLEVLLPPNHADATRYPEAFVSRVRELAVNHHDSEIAQLLDAEGHQSSTGKPLTRSMIQWVRYTHRIPAPKPPANTFSVKQVCERYGVSKDVVHYWIDRGVIAAEQRKHDTPYAITIDDDSDRRTREWIAQSVHLPRSSQTQTGRGAL
jgi:hypothetical protein